MSYTSTFLSTPGACHEAGHAVVARHLGLLIREATYAIGYGGCDSGHVDYLPCAIFEAYPMVAGYVAHLKAAGKKKSMHLSIAASSDFQRLRSVLGPHLDFDQAYTYQCKLEDDVAGFLYKPEVWKCVVGFAGALNRSGRLNSRECMRLTEDVPRATFADIQRKMLTPTLHDHMGRFGRKKRAQQEKLIGEIVERLRPAFHIHPPFDDIRRLLQHEGYSKDEVERLMRDTYAFWLQPQ